jgi:predicted acylesterase/phospholipase RssA
MASARKRLEIGVVLQGGGALGAYECGAASALLELMDNEAKSGRPVALVAVSGVSIGAVNAACMVGASDWADARRRLAALWDDLMLEMPEPWSSARWDLSQYGGPNINVPRDLSLLGLPGFYAPRTNVLSIRNWTSYYDTSPMIETLKRHVDFARLNASPTHFVVSAINVRSGVLTRFCNYTTGQSKAAPAEKNQPVPIEPQHILASGSLPPQFPWTRIDDKTSGKSEFYWDGGIVDNTPLGEVVDAFSSGDDVDRVAVVMNLYPLVGRLPRNLAEVEDRKHELSFGNRLRQDGNTAARINDLLETIKRLKSIAKQPLGKELQQRVDHAGKILQVVEIDLQRYDEKDQDSLRTVDDADGLRDFSRATVTFRQERGRERAADALAKVFSTTLPARDSGPKAGRTATSRHA